MTRPEPSTNHAIVMVDWARRNEVTPSTRDEFLWHQMLLSLLYDDVLAQDEILVCSKNLPKWFQDGESFRLMEEIVECGGIGVLKRPRERYPRELQERALTQPITVRREHLETFSVDNDGNPLRFDSKQLEFHNRLEALLVGHPHAHRDAGTEKKLGKDLMQEFGNLLVTVFTDPHYQKWLRSKFRSITPETASDFVRFVRDPRQAVERLKRKRPDQRARFTPDQRGEPVFSTALAVQVAATYQNEAEDLQNLIETVFAKPFCQDEGADGRYGRLLRELPLTVEEKGDTGTGRIVKIEAEIRIPLRLPWPGPNFSEIIQAVRNGDSGRKLRGVMKKPGPDLTFAKAINAWHAVADEIASKAGTASLKQIDLRMLAMVAGAEFFWGAMVDLVHNLPTRLEDVPSFVAWSSAVPLAHVGGELCTEVFKIGREEQRLIQQLRSAIDFTCIRHQ